jgi:hypothetical protein
MKKGNRIETGEEKERQISGEMKRSWFLFWFRYCILIAGSQAGINLLESAGDRGHVGPGSTQSGLLLSADSYYTLHTDRYCSLHIGIILSTDRSTPLYRQVLLSTDRYYSLRTSTTLYKQVYSSLRTGLLPCTDRYSSLQTGIALYKQVSLHYSSLQTGTGLFFTNRSIPLC